MGSDTYVLLQIHEGLVAFAYLQIIFWSFEVCVSIVFVQLYTYWYIIYSLFVTFAAAESVPSYVKLFRNIVFWFLDRFVDILDTLIIISHVTP